ncbi:hypothetical protein JCM8547_009062 [Rhodosporidiobolus lusitaniae]
MEEYESVLFVSRDVYVYSIPPRTSNAGYRAAEWGEMTEPMWRGRLRVLEKGAEAPTKCFLNLEDKETGELFAQAPYQPTKANPNGGCEAVLDSSRYFVLTVVDATTKQKAYVGMGFPERSESFDFNVALQDWSKRQTPPSASSLSSSSSDPSATTGPSPHLPPGGSRDFRLKAGETLSIKLGGQSVKKKAPSPGGGGGAGLGAFKLAPPPPPPARK